MARGWESKSVEAQIDAADHRNRAPHHPPQDSQQLDALRKRENLLSSRARVAREREAAQNPRYVAILDKALADLDTQLSALEEKPAAAHA
jgi:hypothetical protein